MKCKNHQDIEAQGMCVLCGKPFCENCIVDVSGKNKCRECLKSEPSNEGGDVSGFWNGVAFCCCIMIILGALG